MKKRKIAFLLLAALLTLPGIAQVQTSRQPIKVYQPEKYVFSHGVSIYNTQNRYDVYLTLTKPEGAKPPKFDLRLFAGEFGFNPLIQFLGIKVNGIPLEKINAAADDIQEWRGKNRAGAEIKLNFDGAKYILLFYMRDDSPVLWASLKPAPDSVEETEKLELSFSMIPSKLILEDKQPVWGGKGLYAREVVMPTRTISQRKDSYQLTPQDCEFTFRDAVLDGSAADKSKGMGPCWLQMETAPVANGILHLQDYWTTNMILTMKPDMKEFRFALWQRKAPLSNADFAKMRKEQAAAFQRKE